MRLPAAVKAYVLAVAVASSAFLFAWIAAWPLQEPRTWFLPITLAVFSVLARLLPIRLSRSRKVTLHDAVSFALLLIYGPPAAMIVAGGGALVANFIHLQRGRRDAWNLIFNASLAMLEVALAGAVLMLAGHARGAARFDSPGALIAVPLAAATAYATNSLGVSLAIGLQHGRNPLDVWRIRWQLSVLQSCALYLVGVVAALLAGSYPWAVIIMAVPTALIYLGLKRSVQLLEQTVAAVEAMADVVDQRDHYTWGHCRRTADYAVLLARRLGLPAEEVERIRLAARVHDLGKVGIPDAVLLKEGPLTESERAVMEQHTRIGYEILARFPEYARGRDLVYSHHERYDGNGYPRALEGRSVALSAQVIPVADALDAMTTDRPYRRALSLDQALAEFRRYKGIQWHPDVVQALEDIVATEGAQVLISSTEAAPA